MSATSSTSPSRAPATSPTAAIPPSNRRSRAQATCAKSSLKQSDPDTVSGSLRVLRGLAERHHVCPLRQALQRPLLDLTCALGRDAELASGLAERLGLLVAGAE